MTVRYFSHDDKDMKDLRTNITNNTNDTYVLPNIDGRQRQQRHHDRHYRLLFQEETKQKEESFIERRMSTAIDTIDVSKIIYQNQYNLR